MQEEGGNSPQSNRGEAYEYSTPTIFFWGGTGTYGFFFLYVFSLGRQEEALRGDALSSVQ